MKRYRFLQTPGAPSTSFLQQVTREAVYFDDFVNHVLSGYQVMEYTVDGNTLKELMGPTEISGLTLTPTSGTALELRKNGWTVVLTTVGAVTAANSMKISLRQSVAGSNSTVRGSFLGLEPQRAIGAGVLLMNAGINAAGTANAVAPITLRDDKAWTMQVGFCPFVGHTDGKMVFNVGLAGGSSTWYTAPTTAGLDKIGFLVTLDHVTQSFQIEPCLSNGATAVTGLGTISPDEATQLTDPVIFDCEISCNGQGRVTGRYRTRTDSAVGSWTALTGSADISGWATGDITVGPHFAAHSIAGTLPAAGQCGLYVDHIYFAQER